MINNILCIQGLYQVVPNVEAKTTILASSLGTPQTSAHIAVYMYFSYTENSRMFYDVLFDFVVRALLCLVSLYAFWKMVNPYSKPTQQHLYMFAKSPTKYAVIRTLLQDITNNVCNRYILHTTHMRKNASDVCEKCDVEHRI